jgi:hypothetical protein
VRTRAKEIAFIVELLSKEHDSVDDLAKEVWSLMDSIRRERELWVAAVQYKALGVMLFGPYESETTANKDLDKRATSRGLVPNNIGRVFKVHSPSNMLVTESLQEEGILDYR